MRRSTAVSPKTRSGLQARSKGAAETDAHLVFVVVVVFISRIGPEESVAASIGALELEVEVGDPTATRLSGLQ